MEKLYLALSYLFCNSGRLRRGRMKTAIIPFLGMLLSFSNAEQVAAQYSAFDDFKITGTGSDEYGVYVAFRFPAVMLEISTFGEIKADGNVELSYKNNGGTYIVGDIFSYHGSLATHRVRVQYWEEDQNTGFRAFNFGSSPGWSNYMDGTSGNSEVYVNVPLLGTIMNVDIKWYVPDELIGKELTFKVWQRYIVYGNPAGSKTSVVKFNGKESNVFAPPLPEANLLTGEIADNPGNLLVKYAYDGTITQPDVTVRHWLDDSIDQKVTDDTNVDPAGFLEVAMDNKESWHTFHSEFIGKGGYLKYTQSQDFELPPYVWPENLTAEYDDENKVTLTWDARKVHGEQGVDYIMRTGGAYEIIRSTDPEFLVYDHLPDLPYVPEKDSYKFEDDLSSLKEGTTVYYRVRRSETGTKWAWEEHRETAVPIKVTTVLTPDTVQLVDGPDGPVANITWEPIEGVWLDDTKFSLKKLNLTRGTPPELIQINEEAARAGMIQDKNISYCNEFVYALVMELGGDYDSPPEADVPGGILAMDIGTIRGLSASKGYFPDRTEFTWSAEGLFDKYLLKRRIYGSGDNFVQIATVPGSATTGDIQTDDTKGIPGIYYEYMVVGAVNCGNVTRYSKDTLYAVGFRSPTGTIYGRITYENGQAVENVAVRLESANNSRLGQSVYLNGSSQSFLKVDSLQKPFADSAFTVEAWVRPDDEHPVNQVIFSQDGRYELGFDGTGDLYFRSGTQIVKGAYFNLNQSFVHLAGIYGRDSIGLMLNDSLIAIVPCMDLPGGKRDTTVYIGRNAAGNNFKGHIDEMRVWNIARDPAQLARDHTRLMAGNETGLVAYWRFDETIVDEFYDISNVNSMYNRNDGVISSQAMHSSSIPEPAQLSLKAFTDITGNYMISGIPFTGNGTTYTIVPLLGTHQFDPISVNRLISSNSLEFTVNFVDKSSFPVSGFVYYQNTTVPVKGVQFMIDGKYAQKENGQLFETDDFGRFTIYVPVGYHEVRAVKSNHVFVNNGKITNWLGENLNYQGRVSERILLDSTTVRFIGRVAGGVVQGDLPLGHSLSTNNLGENLSISMTLAGPSNRKLKVGASDSTLIFPHHVQQGHQGAASGHQTRVIFDASEITIFPDSVTGEFAVDLIPENFNVTSVRATGHTSLNLPESLPVNINLTNKFFVEKEIYAPSDSTVADTVYYNYSHKFIERNKPDIRVSQLDGSGKELVYFGDTVVAVTMLNNQGADVTVYDLSSNSYLFGYPVFEQNQSYRLYITAFEQYDYFKEDNLQTPAFTDRVPSLDGLVSVANDLRYGSSAPDTLSLNENGEGIYQFKVGEPEISNGIGRKGFSVSVKIGNQLPILWNNGEKLEGYIMGWKKTGTDFITAGPNEIVRVLRDPPGSGSYSWLDEGTTTITEKEYAGSITQAGSEELKNSLGAATITFAGVGAGTITVVEAGNTYAGKISHSETFNGTDKTTTVTKLLSRYASSSDPTYVGADADLFIGNSSNFTYGSTLELMTVKNEEIKVGSDKIFFDGAANGIGYSIVRRIGINISQKFGTHFVYTAKHIEDILIPDIITIRNSMFMPVLTPPAVAQQRANELGGEVYVSKLSRDDPNYGASNIDVEAFGTEALTKPWGDGFSYKIYLPEIPGFNQSDTILALNQHIAGWRAELARNEQMKVMPSVLVKNFSFTGGGDVQYSETAGIIETKTNNFNITLGAEFLASIGVTVNKTGMTLNIAEGLTTTHGGNFGESTDNEKTFGFVLSENSLDYLSVDVSRAGDSSFVFRTKGGETACPYEGKTVTKYFIPGTIIDQPTVRAEAPDIIVDKPVSTDIPSTRNATFNIQLQNASETSRGVSFFLQVMEDSNPNGAKISMDGASLATGRALWINPGQVLYKTITLERGPEEMDYEDIQLRLISECDTTAFDLVNISAHFIPSCSDVHIAAPADQWLLNTKADTVSNERYLKVTMDEFDVSNELFGYIDLKYRPLASSTWTTVMKFYADSAVYEAAEAPKSMITGNMIDYKLVMSDASFGDQQYEIKALAVCMAEGQVISTTESNIIRGTKDTYRPRLFGSAQPADGVLGIEDDVRLNFNEAIAAGLLSYPDFQVTGIRNGTPGDHTVSVHLDGQDDYLATEFNKSLEGKDLTVEMWVLPDGRPVGTLFSHGDVNQSIELAFVSGEYLQVTVGQTTWKSEAPVSFQEDQWAHVALVYDSEKSTVSAFYNFVEVIHGADVAPYDGVGPVEFGRSIGQQGNTFKGNLHEARIWTEKRSDIQLQINSMKRLSGGENGLLAYYPMTEGKGDLAYDKAHGAHARLYGQWTTPAGKAVAFGGNGYLAVNTASVPVTDRMDYTMELWFKAAPGQGDAALASSGKGDGTDNAGSENLFFLGFENGQLTFRNNGVMAQANGDFLDNDWHHVAIAVNRNSGRAQFYVDGVLNMYFDAAGLGGIAAASVYLGARGWYMKDNADHVTFDRYFTGVIDGFRLWNTYLDATLINNNSNILLKGDELGLMLYYPFEEFMGEDVAYTLQDQKILQDPTQENEKAIEVNVGQTDDKAPVKGRGPVSNLQFDFVVNDDGLIINLLEPRYAIDKTLVTFRVENVRDLNGNAIESPVTWTAYIDRNQLNWSDDRFDLTKELYKPLSFESHILNSGGTDQQFTLENLPPWLKANPSGGTIDPQGNQKVVFTVNEGLNAGTYDEIVSMRNEDGENQTLPIHLKVRAESPAWTVNPEEFEYSMTVYGKLRINNIFSSDPDDLLAVFSGGKCVGVTKNVYNEANDLWYAFLTIYSKASVQDDLEFRIWDASTGKIFQGVPSAAVIFANGAIAGTAREPIVFTGEELLFQEIALNQGWNWISLNLTGPKMNDINATLAGGEWQTGDILKNEQLGFESYSAEYGWVGTLTGFNNRSLFMLRSTTAQQLSIAGIPPDIATTPIPVEGGQWNYISYLPPTNMTVQEALAGYEASDEDVIKSQTGFAMYDSQTGWVGNLSYLEPGKGYMLFRKAGSDVSFFYPVQGGTLSESAFAEASDGILLRSGGGSGEGTGNSQLLNPLQSPVSDNYRFAGNMTIVATVDDDFGLRPGDRLLARVDGELRGRAQVMSLRASGRQRFFLNVSGDESSVVHFEIERQGKVVARSVTTIGYDSDAHAGTPDDPLVIRIETEAATVLMYPNPFSSLINIEGEIHGGDATQTSNTSHRVQLKVYDVTGGLVLERLPERVTGNRFHITWNGRNAGGQSCRPGVYFIHVVIDGRPVSGKVIKVDTPK